MCCTLYGDTASTWPDYFKGYPRLSWVLPGTADPGPWRSSVGVCRTRTVYFWSSSRIGSAVTPQLFMCSCFPGCSLNDCGLEPQSTGNSLVPRISRNCNILVSCFGYRLVSCLPTARLRLPLIKSELSQVRFEMTVAILPNGYIRTALLP